MPDYTIRDPQSGRTMTVRGESPPTEQELELLFGPALPADATAGMLPASTPAGDPALPRGSMLPAAVQASGPLPGIVARLKRGPFDGLRDDSGKPAQINGEQAIPSLLFPTAIGGSPVLEAVKSIPGIVKTVKDYALQRPLGISATRAGSNIHGAAEAAKDVALNVEQVGAEGLRAMELQAAGGSLPRAVTQFMQRITNPKAADLTFGEARDFYSNLSRLSTNEFNRMNPVMQRQVVQIKQALHEALVEGAETVGKGQQYAEGISEYAKAAQAAKRWEQAKPLVTKALARIAQGAGMGVGGAAAYGAFKN